MKPTPAELDAPCLPSCRAHGAPLTLAHSPGCRWKPMGAFIERVVVDPVAPAQVDAAIESARAERAAIGPASNGRGTWGARPKP